MRIQSAKQHISTVCRCNSLIWSVLRHTFTQASFFFLSLGSFRIHTYCLKRNGIFGLRPSEIENCLLLLFFEDSSHEQLFFLFFFPHVRRQRSGFKK